MHSQSAVVGADGLKSIVNPPFPHFAYKTVFFQFPKYIRMSLYQYNAVQQNLSQIIINIKMSNPQAYPPPPIYNVSQDNLNPSIILQPQQPAKNDIISNQAYQTSLYSNARNNFVIKVYTILMIQIVVTIGICCASYLSPAFFAFQIQQYWLAIVCSVLMVIIMFAIDCCKIGRQHPINLILLLIFTLGFSYLVSYSSTWYAYAYGAGTVINAAIITLVIVIALSVFACFTKGDFTDMLLFPIILIVLASFACFGFLCFLSWSPILYNLYCTLICIVAGIILLIDTQMIIGGGRYELGMDEYVFAALILYVDIMRLFLYILRAMGSKRR